MKFYRFALFIVTLWCRIRGCKFYGLEHLLSDGPVVIMSNHTHWADPIYLGVAYQKRPIHFIAKEEFFQKKWRDKILRCLGSFPVARGEADLSALKTAFGLLRKNEVLGIFPEGTRNKDKVGVLPFKHGAVLIAYKGKAPIIPVGIKNSENLLKFWKPKPEISVGAPIYFQIPTGEKPNNQEIIETYTQTAQQAVADLLKELGQ